MSSSNDKHIFESVGLFEISERDYPVKFFDKFDVGGEPSGSISRRLGVVVFRFRIELGWIGVSTSCYAHCADNACRVTDAVIEECHVSGIEVITKKIANSVVSAAFPDIGAAFGFEVIDAVRFGFGFHQPVAHELGLPVFIEVILGSIW